MFNKMPCESQAVSDNNGVPQSVICGWLRDEELCDFVDMDR